MFFQYQEGVIYYTSLGTGNPVVLLHGYLETSDVWRSFAQKLSEKFRVITIDLPGHGRSGSFGPVNSMEFMATAVKELLDSLSIKKFFLTGHSLGGYVALAFLDMMSERLSGYCLFHSQPFPDMPETVEKRKREISLVQQGNKKIFYPENIRKMFASTNLEAFSGAVQQLTETASQLDGEGIIAILNGMMIRPSRVSIIEEGRVPFLWILGAMDNYIPCDIHTRVRLPSNSKLVVLKNSGHLGFIEEEELSVKTLSDFVLSIR